MNQMTVLNFTQTPFVFQRCLLRSERDHCQTCQRYFKGWKPKALQTESLHKPFREKDRSDVKLHLQTESP